MYPIRDYLDRPLSSLPELRALGEQCDAAAATHVGASALGAASPLEPTADALEGLSLPPTDGVRLVYFAMASRPFADARHFASNYACLDVPLGALVQLVSNKSLHGGGALIQLITHDSSLKVRVGATRHDFRQAILTRKLPQPARGSEPTHVSGDNRAYVVGVGGGRGRRGRRGPLVGYPRGERSERRERRRDAGGRGDDARGYSGDV